MTTVKLPFFDILKIQEFNPALLLVVKLSLRASLLIKESALALAGFAESRGLRSSACGHT